jgi:peptide/nickel transport system ATP-binding protein
MKAPDTHTPVLAVTNLGIGFRSTLPDSSAEAVLAAVQGFDLMVHVGETVAIVGESGCGKSITALALAGLLPADARITSGHIDLLGQRISAFPESRLRHLRGNRIGMIFQDPMSALNPVLTIGEQIEEAILAHQAITRKEARAQAEDLLARVRLPKPRERMADYPHQLSGGMRQRVMIAIAISNQPDLLIADEPTTALDATVQFEILSLLHDIQRASGMALIMITHDLGIVDRWAERVAVMYAGRKVEERATKKLLERPLHPYTHALIRARPSRRPAHGPRHRLTEIAGMVPAIGTHQAGCVFSSRCAVAVERCFVEGPTLDDLADDPGVVACHLATERTAPCLEPA